MKRRNLLGIAVAVTMSACGSSAPPAAPASNPPAPPTSEAPADDVVAPTEARAAIAAALDDIGEGAAAQQWARVRARLWPWTSPDGALVPDLISDGIRTGDGSGDFSYSRKSLQALREQIDAFTPPSPDLAERLAAMFGGQDAELTALARGDGGSLWIYERDQTRVVFAVKDGQAWLVFWEGLAELTAPETPPAATTTP